MKQLSIVFSHTNYLRIVSGTERVIGDIAQAILKSNNAIMQVFPLNNELRVKQGYVGVNLNNRFLGVYKLRNIASLYRYQCYKNSYVPGIVQIHHLFGFDVNDVKKTLNDLDLKICIFIHDYYFVCSSFTMINSQGDFCGVSCPNNKKCIKCSYFEDGLKHYKLVRQFLTDIKSKIIRIYVPSNYVYCSFLNVYPEFKDIVLIRPHLIVEETKRNGEYKHDMLRIGFVGLQHDSKGYGHFKELVSICDHNRYEFHYFGIGDEQLVGVINHYVSTLKQGLNAMSSALQDNEIDICLFWSLCPETYSFSYYEMCTAGCFVLTNEKSGNVSDMVRKNGNGIVFSSFDECIKMFKDYKIIVTCHNYQKNSHSLKSKANDNLKDILCNNRNEMSSKKAVRNNWLLTYKYEKILNVE